MFPLRLKHALAGIFLAFTTITTGCTVTHITAPAPADALKRDADAAAADFSVHWVNDKTLEISDAWVAHSILALGYTRFCADLEYDNGQLEGDFYLKTNNLMTLFLPATLDTGPGFVGALLKPTMRGQMEDILGWAGVERDGRTVKHGSR